MSISVSDFPRMARAARRSRLASLAPWLVALGLDLLLFVPSYVFSEPQAAFWPFFPNPKQHAHGAFGLDLRSAYQYLLALTLRRDNLDVFRVSVDMAVLVLVAIWSADTRARAWLRRACVAAYLWLWVFLAYDHAIRYYYWRSAALGEDWRLALNLFHFVGAMMSPSTLARLIGGALALIGVGMALAFALRALQLSAAGWSLRRKGLLTLALLLPALASLSWFGVQRDEPVIQLLSKRMLYNWRASRAEAIRMAPLRSGVADRRYASYAKVALRQKPNFYLLMVEAYGEILATWDMRPAYEALQARVQTRLERAAFHACSAYSAAPVHGGTSWLSIATVQTGILIDRPLPYSALELTGARVPSLAGFFNGQGYESYTLQPGTRARAGLHRLDLFNHHILIDASAIGYQGPHFGWGHIPDQYSLGVLRERYLAHAPEPRYVFYMGVSTHFPWGEDVPPYVRDWHALDASHADARKIERADVDASWPALPHKDEIATELRRSYFQSVEYEWRLFTELLEADRSREIVVVVLGDHQPRLESNPPGEVTMNTPLHILSRDAAFVASFADVGCQPGLFADPTLHPPLQHEALFSLWVSKLAARYAEPGSAGNARYFPDGIGLSGLNP
jgi:hypothetical protein